MRGLLGKQKQYIRPSRVYLIVRFWCVTKMNLFTRGLSKSQLRFSLIIFTIFGTLLSAYTALSGFLADSPESIRIDAITVLSTDCKNQSIEKIFPDVPASKYSSQSDLSRYIDSVINAAEVIDLPKNDYFNANELTKNTKNDESNSSNYKKYNYGK